MAKQLTSKDTLLLKVGGVPDATNVVTTDNRILINPNVATIEYNDFGNGKGGNAKVITNDEDTTAEFSVDVVARTSGALGVAPVYADMLKCCALQETVTASTDVVYTPMLVEQQATAKAYLDGEMRNITGIAGDFEITGKVGELAKFNFSLKGFTDLVPVAEENPTVTLDSNLKLVVKSAVVTVAGGGTINLNEFDFKLANDVKKIYAIGQLEYFVSDFKPTLTVKAVKVKGNVDHWSELQSNTKKSITITLGSSDGDIIELTAPFCNPQSTSDSDSDAKVVYERTWICENSAGGDNFSLTYK